jgi:hypothetical protein
MIRDDDPERVFAGGGAIKAMVATSKAGKTRFLEFTGHKSRRIHLEVLDAARANGFHPDILVAEEADGSRGHYSVRRNATRSFFSGSVSFVSSTTLKNSTVSSSVRRRPSCR